MTDVPRNEANTEEALRGELREQEQSDTRLVTQLRDGERREGELAEEIRELERHEDGTVETKVSFPLAGKGPYRADEPRGEKAQEVLRRAMDYFGVRDDQTATYKLAHNGMAVDALKTVGEIAGDECTLKLTLVKELIQG